MDKPIVRLPVADSVDDDPPAGHAAESPSRPGEVGCLPCFSDRPYQPQAAVVEQLPPSLASADLPDYNVWLKVAVRQRGHHYHTAARQLGAARLGQGVRDRLAVGALRGS